MAERLEGRVRDERGDGQRWEAKGLGRFEIGKEAKVNGMAERPEEKEWERRKGKCRGGEGVSERPELEREAGAEQNQAGGGGGRGERRGGGRVEAAALPVRRVGEEEGERVRRQPGAGGWRQRRFRLGGWGRRKLPVAATGAGLPRRILAGSWKPIPSLALWMDGALYL